jgi:MSHA biogenesis protein MshG
MPQFTYYGRNQDNQPVRGTLDATNASNVVDWLAQTGITPVSIDEVVRSWKVADLLQQVQGHHRISTLDLLMFTRQLHALTKAGIPLMRALRGLEQSTSQKPMKVLLNELLQSLESGVELSQALARRPEVFDSFYITMVRVGETAGRQEEVLLGLCDHLEFERYMQEQVRSALRYPLFVIVALVVALVVINIFVIPAFAKVFANLHTELPFITRCLISTSYFFVHGWPALLAAGAVAAAAARLYLASEDGQRKWSRIKLRLPIAGEIITKSVLSQAMRSMALVFRSGVPVAQGLTLSAQVVQNAYVSQALHGMRDQVERGDSMLAASQRAGVFTPLVLQMIAVGEEAGRLAEMLDDVSRMYQRDAEYGLKSLSDQIEPILITMIGAMVLVLALGVFLPMWDLGSAAIK